MKDRRTVEYSSNNFFFYIASLFYFVVGCLIFVEYGCSISVVSLRPFIYGLVVGLIFFVLTIFFEKTTTAGKRLLSLLKDVVSDASGPSIYLIGITGAFGEEMFFRCFLLGYIKNNSGKFASIAVTGIIFGLLHGFFSKKLWFWSVEATIFGFFAAYGVIYFHSIVFSLTAHSIINILGIWMLRKLSLED